MTDLEKAQDQLELALKEIKSIKGRNVELLYDYVFEAHRLVKKLTIPHVVQQSEQLKAFLRWAENEWMETPPERQWEQMFDEYLKSL